MKITKYDKTAIVSSIMDDVPKPKHAALVAEIQATLAAGMSDQARKLYKTHPKALASDRLYGSSYGLDYAMMFIVGDANVSKVLKPFVDAEETRTQARSKVRSAIESCNTLKQLMDRLPEFERYYPTEQQPTKNLPALFNVAADLAKMGWPIERKLVTASA